MQHSLHNIKPTMLKAYKGQAFICFIVFAYYVNYYYLGTLSKPDIALNLSEQFIIY